MIAWETCQLTVLALANNIDQPTHAVRNHRCAAAGGLKRRIREIVLPGRAYK
jgi:hypothetical protein